MSKLQFDTEGLLSCARYAYAPNVLRYCGPDTDGRVGAHVEAKELNDDLFQMLTGFETMYPYLVEIAHANHLTDPFDRRVVEAYWIGNQLLNTIDAQTTYNTLADVQKLKKRLNPREAQVLFNKIDQSPRLHHSFHVLNVFTRTGHRMIAHTVETMDACLIGHGKVTKLHAGTAVLKSPLLQYSSEKKLHFITGIREITVSDPHLYDLLAIGDLLTCHWGFACDKISVTQATFLQRLTEHHLLLANQNV